MNSRAGEAAVETLPIHGGVATHSQKRGRRWTVWNSSVGMSDTGLTQLLHHRRRVTDCWRTPPPPSIGGVSTDPPAYSKAKLTGERKLQEKICPYHGGKLWKKSCLSTKKNYWKMKFSGKWWIFFPVAMKIFWQKVNPNFQNGKNVLLVVFVVTFHFKVKPKKNWK